MGNRRRIKFQGNLIQFIVPRCFQSGLVVPPPHRLSSVASCFHSNLLNNNNNNNVGSKGNNNFLNDSLMFINGMIYRRPPPSPHLLYDDLKQKYPRSLDFLKQMCVPSVRNNYTTAIKCYCRLGQSKLGFTVLGCCFKQGIQPRVSIYNTILKGFIREDKTHEAERLFGKLIRNRLWVPDVVTYNTMIQGLCKIGNNYTAIALLRLMDHGSVVDCKPDIVTYNTIIRSLCNATVIMIDDAFKLFDEMVLHKAIAPDVLTYNSLIYALGKLGRWDEVSRMLKQMEGSNISPQLKTFNIVVDALCKQRLVNEARLVIDIMLEATPRPKYPPDIVTYNSLIEGYCLRREMTAAKTLFDSLPSKSVKPNTDTYNNLLDGYCKDLKIREAVRLYNDHGKKRVKPKLNMVTHYIMFGAVLEAKRHNIVLCEPHDWMQSPDQLRSEKDCYIMHLKTYCNIDIETARALYHFMDGSKLNSDIKVYNVLIDSAIKWGRFDVARHLFHDMFLKGLQPDVETYRMMISGFCHGGLLKDAKQLFLKMEKGDCPPNKIIANDLVQGYCEKKLFVYAYNLFNEIRRNYVISPSNMARLYDQVIAREPHNIRIKLLREVLPEEWKDVSSDLETDYYEYEPYKD